MGTPPQGSPAGDEQRLIAALKAGDEAAFGELVDRYHAGLVRLAMTYVRSRAVAEEVAQETWIGVLRGLPRFEGRSSLRTWITRILVNQAKTRALRERRSVPLSSLAGELDDGPAIDPDRFRNPLHPGGWSDPPQSWAELPEERLLGAETRAKVLEAIEQLPPMQRRVITLRDVDGWDAAEVRDLLELSEVNQRVLLHRARSRVREALERYLADDQDAAATPTPTGQETPVPPRPQ
jgi:RNA polymerase sigma-70 factor, ECF subfamily